MVKKDTTQTNQTLFEILNGKTFSELPQELQKQFLKTPIQIASIQLKGRKKRIEKTTINYSIEQLKEMWDNGEITLPKYQRGKVWDIKKKSELIYSLFTLAIPEIITYERKGKKYLLDGFQRVSTIIDFLDNEFKLKFDENIEHIEPEKGKEEIILKNLFERLNYQSTPLSKYRIVLLALITTDDYEEMEEKTNIIQLTAIRIKQEDKKEDNLGFIERVLASYYYFKEREEKEKLKEEISKQKNIPNILLTILSKYLKDTSIEDLNQLMNYLYEIATIITKNKPQTIVVGAKKKRAEIIGLLLYKLTETYPLILKKNISLFDEAIDHEELIEVVNLLEDRIKDIRTTRNAQTYLTSLETLEKDEELINWEKLCKCPYLKEEKEGKIEEEEGEKIEEEIGENKEEDTPQKEKEDKLQKKEEKKEENKPKQGEEEGNKPEKDKEKTIEELQRELEEDFNFDISGF